MILIDAGPLIALINRLDPDHENCKTIIHRYTGPFFSTWPCLAEAMHILGRKFGWHGQRPLLELLHRGTVSLVPIETSDIERITVLMAKYADVPMDLADASLVAIAETHSTRQIFTLDGDFQIYRWRGKRHFELLP